jgi:hypothetical protein
MASATALKRPGWLPHDCDGRGGDLTLRRRDLAGRGGERDADRPCPPCKDNQ